jgi:hypothetical protein
MGGGYCGWAAPQLAINAGEGNASAGGWYLKVKFVDPTNKQYDQYLVVNADGSRYISLVNDNYSAYKLPTRNPWNSSDSNLKTTWTKLRFDPDTMLVNTADYTYSSSVGQVSHHAAPNNRRVAYATAFGCESPNNADGEAVIDLRGTKFAVDDTFNKAGYYGAGTWTFTDNNQKVVVRGGGYCGWAGPSTAVAGGESGVTNGGWHLKLKYFDADQLFVATDGSKYISLVNINYSSYKYPTRRPWNSATNSDLRTTWTKIRFDPSTMLVNTADYTYSSSTGKVSHHAAPNDTRVAFATAFGCEASYNADGEAVIDLRGTNFAVDDTFNKGGYNGAGTWTFTDNNQKVVVRGGGYCGWAGPSTAVAGGESGVTNGGWHLKLKRIS